MIAPRTIALDALGDVLLTRADAIYRERVLWRLGRWLLRGAIERTSSLFDSATYGGAPILGLRNLVIEAHGGSNARALENAVKLAAVAVRDDECGRTEAGIREIAGS